MIVRRIIADSMPEALAKIKKELGKDAVILDTKRVSEKKWMGLKKVSRLEVLATIQSDVPELQHQFSKSDQKSAQKETQNASNKSVSVSEQDKGVYEEISKLKGMLQSVLRTQDTILDTLVDQLTEQGLTKSQVLQLVTNTENLEQGQAKNVIKNRLMDELDCVRVSQPIALSSKVVAFVGPTGVGKTTTIAKIAATESLTKGRKVGLITADTYRVAAIDQLKTYANILTVPLEVVYKREELNDALDRLKHCDLILIDTAGRNYRSSSYVDEIREFIEDVPIDETFLVLSLTAKSSDMNKVASMFDQLNIDKFIFTKFDETDSYGSILNLLLTYKKPISYITIGQNVPNDIEVPSLDKIITLVLDGVQ